MPSCVGFMIRRKEEHGMEESSILLAAGEGILLLLTAVSMHRIKRIEREIQKNIKIQVKDVKTETLPVETESIAEEISVGNGEIEQISTKETAEEQERLIDSILEEIFS